MYEVKKYQYVISSKQAKAVGKQGLLKQTQEMFTDFYNDLAKEILNSEDDHFIVQLGIGKLDSKEVEDLKCL